MSLFSHTRANLDHPGLGLGLEDHIGQHSVGAVAEAVWRDSGGDSGQVAAAAEVFGAIAAAEGHGKLSAVAAQLRNDLDSMITVTAQRPGSADADAIHTMLNSGYLPSGSGPYYASTSSGSGIGRALDTAGNIGLQMIGPGTLYDRILARPFYNILGALGNTPLGDPGAMMALEQGLGGVHAAGRLPGALGVQAARGLQWINRSYQAMRSARPLDAAESAGEVRTVANPRNLRPIQGPAEMTGSQVKRLSRDMRENGYNADFPITAADVDGRLIIMDGHHRTEAAIRAGLSEVPVRVVPVTPAQASQLGVDAAEAAALRASRRGW